MKLNPYLFFQGNCEEVLNFYAKCLDGKIESLMRYSDAPGMSHPDMDKNSVLHSALTFGNGCTIQAADGMNDGVAGNGNIRLSLEFDSLDAINNAFSKLSEGGKVTMALENTFWNARFGMCTDKYGTSWMLNYQLPQN